MADKKIDLYNIWREPVFQEIWKKPEDGEWTGAKRRELESSGDFLNWLDGRDGEQDGETMSSCIPEGALFEKTGEIKTTHEKREAIRNSVTKFIPTCEEYYNALAKEYDNVLTRFSNGSDLTALEQVALGLYKGDTIGSYHGPEPGFVYMRVRAKVVTVLGEEPAIDTRGLYSKALRKVKEKYGSSGENKSAFVLPPVVVPTVVAEASVVVTGGALLFVAGALATGLIPQSQRTDLRLIAPPVEVSYETFLVKVPKPQQESEETVIEEKPGRTTKEIVLNPDGTELETEFVEDNPGEDHTVWVPNVGEEDYPEPGKTTTEGVINIKNSDDDKSTDEPSPASDSADDVADSSSEGEDELEVGNNPPVPAALQCTEEWGIMVENAMNELSAVLEMRTGDKLLIVTDKKTQDVGVAFEAGAKRLGIEVETYILPEELRPLKEVPKYLEPLITGNEAIINLFEADREEAPFRYKLVTGEMATGARVGHGVGITTEMVTKGPMTVDYEKMSRDAEYLISLFKDAKTVHITTPSGTDITLDIEGRAFVTDVKIKPGKFGNLLVGEVCCAPVETESKGTIVVDGAISYLEQVPAPLRMEVEQGTVVSIESEDQDFVAKVKELTSVDERAKVIGEFGIGLNPGAKVTGDMAEAEKAEGTAHLAIGDNRLIPGGENRSSIHGDLVFRNPTIVVTYKDGTKKTLVLNGKIVR